MVVVFTLGLDICVNEFLILRDNFKFSSKFKVVTQYSYLKRYDVATQQNALKLSVSTIKQGKRQLAVSSFRILYRYFPEDSSRRSLSQ